MKFMLNDQSLIDVIGSNGNIETVEVVTTKARRRQAAWLAILILAAFVGGYLVGHVTGANAMRDRIYERLGYCFVNIY